MQSDRRLFVAGALTGLISLVAGPVVAAGHENTRGRIRRIFKVCECPAHAPVPVPEPQLASTHFGSDADLKSAVAASIKADFRSGLVFDIDGWQVSRTEAWIFNVLQA